MGRKKDEWTISALLDKEKSRLRLKFGDIKGERESTVVAAQDQAVSTKYCHMY
jgi:hypothetical protein